VQARQTNASLVGRRRNLRTYFNWSAFGDKFHELVHFRVRQSYTTIGPVHQAMEPSDPTETVFDAVHHNVAAQRYALSRSTLPIEFVRVRNVHSHLKPASRVLSIQYVVALRSFVVALPYLGPLRISSDGDVIGANFATISKKGHRMLALQHNNLIGLDRGNGRNREPRVAGQGYNNTETGKNTYS